MKRQVVGLSLALCATVAGAPRASAQHMTVSEASPVRVPRGAEALLARPVSLDVARVSLERAILTLAANANVPIQYRGRIFDGYVTPVTLRLTQVPLGEALDRVLRGTDLRVVPDGETRLTLVAGKAGDDVAQASGTLVGTVVNAKTKQPISGATVLVDDAPKGILVGEDGTFRLSVPVGEHRITVRAVGFLKQTRPVTVEEGKTVNVDFTMDASSNVLNEVIVTGTVAATERKAIPTPITVITAEDIEKRGITRVDQLFRGEIPGVIATEQGTSVYNSSTLGATSAARVLVRGSADLDGGANPLKTYVDGVEIVDPSYLGTIDPQSIERIEIVTGPQAATIYGSGAMGGVMQIFTKKGSGTDRPEVTVSLKYGLLESNLSAGRTPTHTDALTVTGGTGPAFTYSGNVSYNYSGQWQPDLYSRRYGASIGATHTRGPFTASGSFSTTAGSNGTYGESFFYDGPLLKKLASQGEYIYSGGVRYSDGSSQIVSKATSQTAGLEANYRMGYGVQHHATIGKSQTNFDLVPSSPKFGTPSDSLYEARSSAGQRTSGVYDLTIVAPRWGALSQTWVAGISGTSATTTTISGGTAAKTATSYVSPTVSKVSTKSAGGFGRMQLGLFDQFYVTVAVRGERSPSYGAKHKIDWTPNYGAAYTQDMGDLTIKVLGSYGRATRAPSPDQRLQILTTSSLYDPAQYISQFANPDLAPEYSRGPQGGLEIYYGNVGSLTINRYQQTVSNLIERLEVDTVERRVLSTGAIVYTGQRQYRNTATVRQQGWELTGSTTLMRVSIRGVYSWNDSRILHALPLPVSDGRNYWVGKSFTSSPTHTGNLTVGYAVGGTSLTLVNNFVGASLVGGRSNQIVYLESLLSRLKMYTNRGVRIEPEFARPGYVKTDFAASQRLTPWASVTLNVTNLGNSYGQEGVNTFTPTLGRQTSLGISLRSRGR